MTTDALWPTHFFVLPAKIAFYLLDPDAAEGASKGAYLTSYGFDASKPQVLEAALLAHAGRDNFQGTETTEWGIKFLFDGPLPAPNGRDAWILTVWQADDTTGGAARFVTARPSRKR